MSDLAGRRIFLTGGGGAIGRAIALRAAGRGASVAVVDVSAEAAAETVRRVADAGGRAVAVTADVGDADEVRAAAAVAADRLGGLDTLVNNAGIMPHQDGSLLGADAALWATIRSVNLDGLVHCCTHVVPHLIAAGGGAIVNMGSFLAVIGCTSPQDGYTATKGAIAALTRSLAVQLGPNRIRVNALAPGPILTPHVEQFFADEQARAVRLARVPLGRFGTPDDAAGLACFLASDDAAWLTGQVVTLDGGISVNYL